MSTLIIEVLSSTVTTVPTAKGSYQVCEVAYKNKSFQDKVEGKKILSFAEKEAFTTLSNASMGNVYTVTRVKDEKGYWKWQSVTAGNSPAQTATSNTTHTANVSPKYETAEERAARQVMIVRQSSIANAIAMLKTDKHSPTTEEVLAIAKQFENYVLNNNTTVASDSFADLSEDIPL